MAQHQVPSEGPSLRQVLGSGSFSPPGCGAMSTALCALPADHIPHPSSALSAAVGYHSMRSCALAVS